MEIESKKNLIIFVFVLILACLIGFGLYSVMLTRLNSVKSQIEQQKERNDVLGTIAMLDRRLQTHKERSLPLKDTTQLIDKLSLLAKEAIIEVETLNPMPTVERDYYVEVPVQIPIKCSYHNLGRFLSLLESNEEFLWVKQLTIKKEIVTDPKKKVLPEVDLVISGIFLRRWREF